MGIKEISQEVRMIHFEYETLNNGRKKGSENCTGTEDRMYFYLWKSVFKGLEVNDLGVGTCSKTRDPTL